MDIVIAIIRSLISIDEDDYSDEILSQIACSAAIIVSSEITIETSYTIDVINSTITPDPDNVFAMFCAYQASIIILQSEIRKKGLKSIKITDGPSSIDLSNIAKDLKLLLDSLLSRYDKLKLDYAMALNSGLAFAVTTPVSANLRYNRRFN